LTRNIGTPLRLASAGYQRISNLNAGQHVSFLRTGLARRVGSQEPVY
jgi:hypothetical protein